MTPQDQSRPVDATLSVTNAAHLLGVHPNTVRAWSEQGRLRYYRINARGDRRYRVGDLRRFLGDAERGSNAPSRAAERDGLRRVDARADRSRPTLRRTIAAPHPTRRERSGPPAHGPVPSAGPLADRGASGHVTRPSASVAIRQLSDLARLVWAGRTLDGILHEAARLVCDATGAVEVGIWELREERFVARATSASTGRAAHGAAPNVAMQAVTQRRPVVQPVGPAAGRQRAGARHSPIPTHESRAHEWNAAAVRLGVEIAVPILGDEPWGCISVRLETLGPGDEAVAWLEAAASLLGAAVRSAGLLDEAAREVHRGEALRRAAIDANGTLDLDETLARVVDHAMVLFSADRGAVFLGQPGGEIAPGASRGLSGAYLAAVRHFPAPSLPADAARERRPMFATNYRDDPRSRTLRAAVVQEGFDTICSAPLIDGDDTIGLLNLYHDRPKAWAPAELDTMAALASQVTVAVRTAQQYTQLARWAAQLQSIQKLGARLNRLTTVPEIASAIATELRVLIQHDNIRVHRLEGDVLQAVALHATHDAYLDEAPRLVQSRIGEGITGWVAANGIAQNLPDCSVDPRTRDVPGSEQFDESMLLAPLIFEDRVLGVLSLARRGLRQFSDDDLRLLEIYASIAAQAMANADATERLRAESEMLQRQLRSQRELLQITESILSTLDPRAVLIQIADRLGRLVAYDTLAIDVHDRHTGTLVPLTSRGPDGEPRQHPAADDGFPIWVVRHNQARLIQGTPAGDEVPPSRIVVPLRGRDGVAGVLTLTRAPELEPFTGDEFELVQLFAAQASVALQNSETQA